MLDPRTKTTTVRKVVPILLAPGLVLSAGLAPLPLGAAPRPPFTDVTGDVSKMDGNYQIVSVPLGQPFLVTGFECTDETPYVPPTGSLVFTNVTTGLVLGTVALTSPSYFANCTTAVITDSETLAAGDYRIEAKYVPGGSDPVPASAAAAYTARVGGTCTSASSCSMTRSAKATTKAPGLAVTASGTPAVGTGTINVKIPTGTLQCPKLPKNLAPVADVTPKGFAPTDRVTVIAKLPLASGTSAHQVCFKSTRKFLNQASPTVPTSGPALLLKSAQVANVAPCVMSSKQVGPDVVVAFVIPGVDPRFYIVLPTGRRMWASQMGTGRIGKAYSAQLQTSGGLAPVSWSVGSGSLPKGCVLDRKTGTVRGTPTKKGSYSAVIKATDSAKPPTIATMTLPVKVS